MQSRIVQIICLCILFGLLVLPRIDKRFELIYVAPLKGEFTPAKKPVFTMESWFSGTFQSERDKYYEENIGMRNPLIRLYNQVDYSLFDVAHGGDIIIGKKNHLFQTRYLKAHAGFDFLGDKAIDEKVAKAKEVSSYLLKNGVHLVIVFAPSKADVYPEYVPDHFIKKTGARTNYETYKAKLLESGIPFIDFNGWFQKLRSSSPYSLYPVQGIHWSQYGVYMAMDSLDKYFSKLLNMDLNNLYCDHIVFSDELWSTDYDLGELINVWLELPHPKMPYPELRFEKNPGKERPSMLAIGDSYYWNIFNSGFPSNIFSGGHFWYYNHDVHADSLEHSGVVNYSTFMSDVLRQRIVMIQQTESNLDNLGFGFIENVYELMSGREIINDVLAAEQKIRTDNDWMELIRQKALERNVTIDVMIRQDAEWMVEQHRAKK